MSECVNNSVYRRCRYVQDGCGSSSAGEDCFRGQCDLSVKFIESVSFDARPRLIHSFFRSKDRCANEKFNLLC